MYTITCCIICVIFDMDILYYAQVEQKKILLLIILLHDSFLGVISVGCSCATQTTLEPVPWCSILFVNVTLKKILGKTRLQYDTTLLLHWLRHCCCIDQFS